MSDYEIIYNIGGQTIVTIEGKANTISCGDLILIPSFKLHKIDTPKDNPHSNYWLHFTMENSLFSKHLIENMLQTFGGYSYKIGFDQNLIEIYEKLLTYCENKNDYSHILFEIYFKELMIYIFKKANINLENNFSINNKTHTDVINYVLANFEKIQNLSQITKENNISPTYCNSIFKKHFGVSTAKYIMQLKLKQAEKYLKNYDFSIKQISEMLNFSSSYHFSNTFKTHYGISPLQFRNSKIKY